MALPSLMAACWVGQNSSAIFCHLWTRVHWIKFACVRVSVVCNAVFWLMMSCCIPEIFAMKLCKIVQKFRCFWPPNFGRGSGHQNFWPNFINMDQQRTCGRVWWWSAKRPRILGSWKEKERKKDLNYRCKTEWPVASSHNYNVFMILPWRWWWWRFRDTSLRDT